MRNSLLLFLGLSATWVVLSGYIKPFFLICGLVSCLVSLYFAHRMRVIDNEHLPLYLKLKALLYWPWLMKEIILSSIAVSKIIWKKDMNVKPILDWVKADQKTDTAMATFANSITLTPGTVSINVNNKKVQVHAINNPLMKDLRQGAMHKQVKRYIDTC